MAQTGSFANSFLAAGILLLTGATLALTVKNEKGKIRRELRHLAKAASAARV